MQDYQQLRVYKQAYELVLKTYKITQSFPKHELYSVTSQLRRAALSILLNISEGAGRQTKKDFAHFIQMSIGSIGESETLINISIDLDYADRKTGESILKQLNILRKQLITLNKRLRSQQSH